MPNASAPICRRALLASAAAAAVSAPLLPWTSSPARAAAPMLGPSQPRHYRFRLGSFELTTILDAGVFIDGPWPLIGGDKPREEVDRLMYENLLPANKYRPGFTPLIVNTGTQIILFDVGNGSNGFVPPPDGGWLAAQIGPAGYMPEQVDLVVLSHGHPDHVGGLIENGAAAFPKAEYVIAASEYDFWTRDDHSGEIMKLAQVFRADVVPLAEKIRFIKPGDDIAPGIGALEAHGHTPGHLALHLESKGERILFWGDCAHHQVASLARPDWHNVFDIDMEQAAATRARIFDMAATERLAVAGYHMPFPSLGYVERLNGKGYRWLPYSYQLEL